MEDRHAGETAHQGPEGSGWHLLAGLEPRKHTAHPGQGDLLGSTEGHSGLCCGLPLQRGYLGRVNFGFRFTFIFKVEYFSSIGDNGLEKPVSHHLTPSLRGVSLSLLLSHLSSVG